MGGPGDDYSEDITIDTDGNVYIVGYTTSYSVQNYALLILKYNNTGHFELNETWDTVNTEAGNAIDYDKSGNYLYLAGTQTIGTFPNYDSNAVLLKYNTSLDRKWVIFLDYGLNESGNGVKVDLSGDIYITGDIKNIPSDIEDVFLAKYNSSGKQFWNLTWGIWVEHFTAKDIEIDTRNNIYVVGGIKTLGFSEDVWLGIYGNDGKKLGNITWGNPIVSERGYGIAIDSSNFIYITGTIFLGVINFSNQFLLKLTQYNLSLPVQPESPIQPANNGNDDDDDGGSTLAVPGYNIFITTFLLSIITAVIIEKRLKKKH